VGEMVAEAIVEERFLILPADYEDLVRKRALNIDDFVEELIRKAVD
jgi:hypothetical protein